MRHVLFVSNDIPKDLEMVRKSSETDPLIKMLMKFCRSGWARTKQFDPELKYYHKLQQCFAVENDCLVYRDRVVIPKEMQIKILELLHEGHIGIVRTKMLARQYVWWRNIDNDIEAFINHCSVCQQTQKKASSVTIPWPTPKTVLERVHLDLFYFGKFSFLIIVDAFSR